MPTYIGNARKWTVHAHIALKTLICMCEKCTKVQCLPDNSCNVHISQCNAPLRSHYIMVIKRILTFIIKKIIKKQDGCIFQILRTLVSFMHYVIPYWNNMPYMKLKGMLSENMFFVNFWDLTWPYTINNCACRDVDLC